MSDDLGARSACFTGNGIGTNALGKYLYGYVQKFREIVEKHGGTFSWNEDDGTYYIEVPEENDWELLAELEEMLALNL